MSYEIRLPLFEGPFDLLLFFIERDELDINDIPIARITDDFLGYVHALEKLNLDLASEFIWVAGTLMRIKAKSLLPRPEVNEAGQEIDPRDELVQHLIEYKKFKEVSQIMSRLEDDRAARYDRGNVLAELKEIAALKPDEEELEPIDLFRLLKVYSRVVSRYQAQQARPRHTVIEYPYTIEGQKNHITSKLFYQPRVAFTELIAEASTKIAAIFNFLAILELLQLQKITLTLGEGYNNFWIETRQTEEVTVE